MDALEASEPVPRGYDIHCRELPYSLTLMPYVQQILHTYGTVSQCHRFTIPPSDGMFLGINRGDPLTCHFSERAEPIETGLFICGQLQNEVPVLSCQGWFSLISVQLTPTGFYRLFNTSASPYTDRLTGLQTITAKAEVLEANWLRQPTTADLLSTIECSLLAQAGKHALVEDVEQAVSAIAHCNGLIRVDEVAMQCDVNTRQLRRRFRKIVGVAPKYFAKSLQIKAIMAQLADSANTGGDSNGNGSGSTAGFAKPEALNYSTTYNGAVDWAAPNAEGELTTLADTAFLLWNLQQVQRGIDDLMGIQTLAMDEAAFDEEEAPWEHGFNGSKCAQAGTYQFTSGSAVTAAGTAQLEDLCYSDADLTEHSEFVVDGELTWRHAEFDSSTLITSYFVEFSNLSVTWRDESWTLNGASETLIDSTERAFSLDVTREETGEVFRIQRVIRTDADTQFSERIFDPVHGKLTLRSTQQDITALTDGWADFGGVCDSNAYLSAESNQTDFMVQVA